MSAPNNDQGTPKADAGSPVLFEITLEAEGQVPHVRLSSRLDEEMAAVGRDRVYDAVGRLCRSMAKTTVDSLVENLIRDPADLLDAAEAGEGQFVIRLVYHVENGKEPYLEAEQGSRIPAATTYAHLALLVHGLLETTAVSMLVAAARGTDEPDGTDEDAYGFESSG